VSRYTDRRAGRAAAAGALLTLSACGSREPAVEVLPRLEWCRDGSPDEDLDGFANCEDPDCADHVICRRAFASFERLTERYFWTRSEGKAAELAGLAPGTKNPEPSDVDGDGLSDLVVSAVRYLPGEDGSTAAVPIDVPELALVRSSELSDRSRVQIPAVARQVDAPLVTWQPLMEPRCDLDGDGLDDVVVLYPWPETWDPKLGDPPLIQILFGAVAWKHGGGPPRVLSVTVPETVWRYYGSVDCFGDLDGDGRDDVMVTYGSQFWLDPDRLADLPSLPEASHRIGGGIDHRGVSPAGDLDGDGTQDMFDSRTSYNSRICDLDCIEIAWIVPGGTHLSAAPESQPASWFDEPRPPVVLAVERPEGPPAEGGVWVDFHDLSGDGRPDVIAHTGHQYIYVFDGGLLGDLSEDVVLHLPQAEARILRRMEDPNGDCGRRSRCWASWGPCAFHPWSSGDIDGDGWPDLLVQAFFQEAPASPCPVCDGLGWGVFFGGEEGIAAFDRPWYAMDVLSGPGTVLPYTARLGTAPSIVEDRDGDGMRELLFYGQIGFHEDADLSDPLLLPTAGVMPGSALAEWKR